jgi:hypothetical protein
MSSSSDRAPPEAGGSDDDLQELEILLVEELESEAKKGETKKGH